MSNVKFWLTPARLCGTDTPNCTRPMLPKTVVKSEPSKEMNCGLAGLMAKLSVVQTPLGTGAKLIATAPGNGEVANRPKKVSGTPESCRTATVTCVTPSAIQLPKNAPPLLPKPSWPRCSTGVSPARFAWKLNVPDAYEPPSGPPAATQFSADTPLALRQFAASVVKSSVKDRKSTR